MLFHIGTPHLRPREGTSLAGGGGAGLGLNFSSSHVQTPRSNLVTAAVYHLTPKLSGTKQRRSFYSSQKTNTGQPFPPIKQLMVLWLRRTAFSFVPSFPTHFIFMLSFILHYSSKSIAPFLLPCPRCWEYRDSDLAINEGTQGEIDNSRVIW